MRPYCTSRNFFLFQGNSQMVQKNIQKVLVRLNMVQRKIKFEKFVSEIYIKIILVKNFGNKKSQRFGQIMFFKDGQSKLALQFGQNFISR